MKEYKVLVDANILVAASILYTSSDFGLKHRDYVKCKTLINFFKNNVDRKIGFYTKSIDITSNRVLSDAILNTIREVSQDNAQIDGEKLLGVFSVIYSESLRRLEENKDCLLRETVNEERIKKLMSDVLLFFHVYIKKEIEKQNPRHELERVKNIKATSWILKMVKSAKFDEARRSFPHYGILRRKFIESPPGSEDIELLSHAIYFNELYSKRDIQFYLVSMDHHFVEINKEGVINNFVPNFIENKWGVKCLNPEKIMEIIK